jgi:hypothetical protein
MPAAFAILLCLPAVLSADARLVIRDAAWGGKRKDTAVVWQTVLIRQTSAKITRAHSFAGGFSDTTELIPNYVDSVFYWMSYGRKYFARAFAGDSAVWAGRLPLNLSGGVLQEKFLTDKRRLADTLCEHRLWIWENGKLDSAGKPVARADLEVELWLPHKGFKGKEDLEFFNGFRKKKFRGWKVIDGVEAARVSAAAGVRLLEFERKAQSNAIFPLEIKITLKRKLAAGQVEYHYLRQVLEIYTQASSAYDFMLPKGYERLKSSDLNQPARSRKK